MSAAAKLDAGQSKVKAKYLVALSKVLNRDQIKLSVALYDDLIEAGISDVSPEHFASVIAAKVPGAEALEAEVRSALGGSGAEGASGGASSQLDPPTEVFSAVMNSVLSQAQKQDSGKFDRICSALPGDLASGGMKKYATTFDNWIEKFQDTGTGVMAMDLPVSSITDLVDILYTVCCDNCGPQATDKFFNAAISDVEKTPAGQQYSPRQLL